MEKTSTRVCVTGAAGYIGSWLVNKLLQKGYIVHGTLRNLGDQAKVGLLKSLPGAESRLFLFKADIYNAEEFEPAVQGCEFVFLVATPLEHYANSTKYKDTTEAATGAVNRILKSCQQSGSVKRVIYTGSVAATSPLKEDGTGFKDFIDESCWTPLHLSFTTHCDDFIEPYTHSKTLSEKELLQYQHEEDNNRMEIVSLACGVVGGDALLPSAPSSVQMVVSPLTGNLLHYRQLKFLQALIGSVPIIHIDDVCDAHVFCMERSSLSGRFLCASDYPAMRELLDYYEQKHPEMNVTKEFEGTDRGIPCNSQKLVDAGFQYKYDMKQILDDSVKCMKRLGGLTESKHPDL